MNINYLTAAINFVIAMVWLRTKIKGNKIMSGLYLITTVLYLLIGATS